MGCFAPFKENNEEIKNILNINNKFPIIGSFGIS